MKEIYPMFKMCRLFLEDGVLWQKDVLTGKILISYGTKKWTDQSLKMERQARILIGDERGIQKIKLAHLYIKKYYPEYTKSTEAFGSIMDYDLLEDEAVVDARQIIDNCLSKKYGFLEEDKNNTDTVYLSSDGRFFASRPYIPISKNTYLNIGLINTYFDTLGSTRIIIFWIISIIGALKFEIIKDFVVRLVT